MALHLVDHPLAQHLLTCLRDKDTDPAFFRRYSRILTTLLVLEATRSLDTQTKTIVTPLENHMGSQLCGGLAAIPILRAGLSMLEPVVDLFPDVAVGYIGLERSDATAIAHSYYCKLPSLAHRTVLCLDPMLATGGSASQAISLIKANGGAKIVMVCVVAAPQGIEKLSTDHPEVPIYSAALDRDLNDLKYILPGLGDFGDRLYGTM
ncbi:MAG: uracil phosphoribosyltransferase [Fimbriimonadaceae bacterium]|nr:uracil phosphoribosyltransferase [Fimbriimonadaceae bacterium]